METILTNMAIEILAPLAAAAAIWALGEVARWARTRTRNEKIANAVERLCQTAASTVAELEQVSVPLARNAASDGKLSVDEGAHLKRVALERIKRRLAPAVLKEARLAIADLDGFLSAKVEQAVWDAKRGPGEALPLIEFDAPPATTGQRP